MPTTMTTPLGSYSGPPSSAPASWLATRPVGQRRWLVLRVTEDDQLLAAVFPTCQDGCTEAEERARAQALAATLNRVYAVDGY